ncbi:MAG: archease [Ardenticatenia bacterium]|nr:archease [Ardenticatenia bacterium]
MIGQQPSCFEEIAHTADVAVRVWGRSLPELFEHAAYAMFRLMAGEELELVEPRHQQDVHVVSLDVESLLVDWLTELLIIFATTGELVVRARVGELAEKRLRARVWTGPLPGALHKEIKAVTYHGLRVERDPKGMWWATIVFDV